jgi:hypothetical protein
MRVEVNFSITLAFNDALSPKKTKMVYHLAFAHFAVYVRPIGIV